MEKSGLISKVAVYVRRTTPFLYEVIKFAKEWILLPRKQHWAARVHNMSKGELKKYDSELYKHCTGEKLDWSNLCTYSEKMQWAKLFDHDQRKVICADKYAVRQWVADRIGDEYLIPIIGVYNKYSEIDFHLLPERFVIKTNHASGDTLVVKNKSRMTLAEKIRMRRIIAISQRTDYGAFLLEWHYSQIKPLSIIVSEFIDAGEKGLTDYKFYCFDGTPQICQVETDRFGDRRVDIYDMEWNLLPWNHGYKTSGRYVEKPANFDKMEEIVLTLSKGFSHVRVDLFNVNGKIYFGEMSFTDESGLRRFAPESANEKLGELWQLRFE